MAYGSMVPTRIDTTTIISSDAVMAVALAMSCVLSHTRTKPPTDRPVPKSTATTPCCLTDRIIHGNVGSSAPVARPRMTLMADWLPAFPPAPTSIVRNRVTNRCSFSSPSYLSSTMLDVLCKISNPSSHLPRVKASLTDVMTGGGVGAAVHRKSGIPRSHAPTKSSSKSIVDTKPCLNSASCCLKSRLASVLCSTALLAAPATVSSLAADATKRDVVCCADGSTLGALFLWGGMQCT
mmetsp:Transcript_5742/g.16438  ORF Transcript_5742/g.16438 Transcript_5742/m.16438 type:complete len:237 (+) Transcript_5742:1134-1844(+)